MAQQIPDITIFARHSRDCAYRDDETYMKCRCRKHLRWSWNGKQYRQSAKTRSREQAILEKRRIEESYVTGKPIKTVANRTIADCVQTFISMKETQGVSVSVLGKYRRELGRLEHFMAQCRITLPSQIGLDELISFRKTWEESYRSSQTRQKVQERLRGFLRYLHDGGHIDKVPRLTPIQVDEPPTLPFSDEEYDELLKLIPKVFKDDPRHASKMRVLVRLGRHSGLAIRDASTLERGLLIHDEKKKLWHVVTARQKTGVPVSVALPPDLAKELVAVMDGNSRYIFWHGNGNPDSATKYWQRQLRQLYPHWKFAGRPHFHRLRDTFAVDLLSKGVPIEEVSKLLGHESVKTTEKDYAKWVKSRQDRLDELVTATWRS